MIPSGRAAAVPWITGKDIAVFVGMPLLFAIAWLIPQTIWQKLSAAIAGAYIRFTSAGRPKELSKRIRVLVGARGLARTPEEIPTAVAVADLRMLLALLRLYRPFARPPQISLEGREHLEEAIAHGRGVVLWVSNFVASSLFAKIALHRAGFRVTHLSHPKHGFSESRVGIKCLNPIRTRLEARYLSDRVVMNPANPIIAMLKVHKRLSENGCVSITVRDYARHADMLPFLDGRHRLAPGAPEIAHLTGARLLPLFAIEDGPNRYRVRIEPPLPIAADATRDAAVKGAMHAYLRRLEPYVLNYPEQWLGWPFEDEYAR